MLQFSGKPCSQALVQLMVWLCHRYPRVSVSQVSVKDRMCHVDLVYFCVYTGVFVCYRCQFSDI